MTKKITIEIIKREKKWSEHKFISKKFIKKIVSIFLENSVYMNKAKSVEMTCLLTDNKEMRDLNMRFLGKDKPTNVLSFPDRELDYKTNTQEDFEGEVILGDVAFGLEITEEEAKEFGISVQNHFTHLLFHAILHLVGFDHENEEDHEIMKTLETTLLRKLDINRPSIYA
ncbi:MAG: rRNA maturation RNase YbeY [Rickettsiaceae bacterium]|nr:rRNA maturation RNase YbeY [Rickettsiaceae bacterium]